MTQASLDCLVELSKIIRAKRGSIKRSAAKWHRVVMMQARLDHLVELDPSHYLLDTSFEHIPEILV